MDESHREIITIKKSRVSCISSEGAHLLKKHLNFFKEKFLEEKADLASLKKDLKQKCQKEKAGVSHKKDMELAWKETMKSASAKAGVSIKELNQKLEKLSTLAKGEDIALAVRMVTDFDDSWLFEILLAGTIVVPASKDSKSQASSKSATILIANSKSSPLASVES
ncbi:MAG: hypothetical protein EBT92_18370, partial [Planctomycetes bacterium]|nr:hypothetical protein [Planctomycetota bacterium]